MGISSSRSPLEISVCVKCVQNDPQYQAGSGRYSILEDTPANNVNSLISNIVGKPVRSFIQGEDVTESAKAIGRYWYDPSTILTLWFEVIDQEAEEDYIDLLDDGYIRIIVDKHKDSSLPSLPNNRIQIFDSVNPRQLNLIMRKLLKLAPDQELYLFGKDKQELKGPLLSDGRVLLITYSEYYYIK